jgi:ABC-type polysaccharide/polyol phosphate export permease
VVESINTILFWLVPIFYSLDDVQQRYHLVYRFNPVAALVVALRSILLDSTSPRMLLLLQLASISVFMLVLGLFVFRRLKERFYDYL